MTAITPISLRALAPGRYLWDRDVGAYKSATGAITWYVRYYAVLPDKTRIRVKEIAKDAENRKQAADVLIARRAEVFRGTWRPHERERVVTFSEFAEGDFLIAKKAQGLRSWERYEQQIRLHLVKHFGRTVTLGGITSADVKAYYEKRLGEVSRATANNEMNCLKSIYAEAFAVGLVHRSPVAPVEMKRANNERKRRIKDAEVARLFRAADALPWRTGRMLFTVLYWTGMRIEEAQSLERAEVDIEDKMIRIGDSKTDRPRTIPILPELLTPLTAWLSSGAGERYLFPGKGNKPVSNTPVRKWWRALLAQTSILGDDAVPPIADLTPHDLRHHFAKLLIDRGVEPRFVMAILGWTSWQMLQRYILPDADEVREAVERAIRSPTVVPKKSHARSRQVTVRHKQKPQIFERGTSGDIG